MANRILNSSGVSKSRIITLLFFILLIVGLVMVGSASVVDAARDFQDKWYYLKLQAFWAVLASMVFIILSNFPHQKLQKFGSAFLLATIFLLILVMIPGVGTKLLGARRWINLGLFSIQPSEIAKLSLGIYFSSLLINHQKFSQFAATLGIVSLLVLFQPDMGTALVIIILSFILYFGSGGAVSKLILMSLVGLGLLGLLIIATPYRFARMKTFFDYSRDPQGSSYQIRQALIGFGSGSIFGVGIGQSKQKYDYLPEATTDSIFAIIGEELGMIGSVSIVLVFLIFILTGLEISKAATGFSSNLALAMVTIIGAQAFINISAITALVPLTGIPLSFISYGGSSLITMASATGIIVNISKTYDRQ